MGADMLRFISSTCTLLQTLEIEFASDKYYSSRKTDEAAIFKELKEFTLSIFSDKMLMNFPVTFQRLQSLKLEIKTSVSGEIIRFIARNDSLRNLQVTFSASIENYLLDNSEIISLTNLTNIESISIQFPIEISANNIIQLLSRCTTVLKLHLKFVAGGEMIIIQSGWSKIVRNDHINSTILRTELDLLEKSRVIEDWNWTTSIDYSQKYIHSIELFFQRKMLTEN